MPRMTVELLAKCTGRAKRKRDEGTEHFLRRVTHLYCAEKGIERIEGLSVCRSLSVLYLYDNFISTLENLGSCKFLTHLYLHNNNITHIANLSSLRKLSKLYLGCNAITVIEGLEGLHNLTELHIAHQRLPEGEKLLFDPRSLSAIAGSLTVLNVSGNNLDSISDLQCLTALSYFSACDNHLSSMKDISCVFAQWHLLTTLELSGNPLCQKHKYRDRVITMGTSIGSLDGREVNETEKVFLLKWKAMRKARKKQLKKSIMSDILYYEDSICDPHISSTKNILLPAPVQPVTLPALPARQLPRKSKKRHQQNQLSSATFPLPDYCDYKGEVRGVKTTEELRLPELVPNQSLIAQSGNILTGLQGDHLQGKSWQISQKTASVFE